MPGIGDTLEDMQWALRDAAARGRTRYNLDRVLYNSPVPEALQHGVTHAWDVLNNPTTTPDIRPGGYDIRMRTHTGGPDAALALKTLGGLSLGYGLYRGGKALHNYLTSPSEEKTGQDMYGFSEKVAHQLTDPEVDEVAWQHNMAGPGYGAEHFDPVQMGIVPASQAHRRFVGGLLGLGGAAVGAGAGGAGWGLPGMVAGAALGGLGGYQLGYHSAPNQLAMRRQPSPEDTQIEQKVGAFYGFSKEAAMAVPGLLHQMRQAAQIAAAHGTKRFNIEQALRPQNGLMPALGKAWDAGTRSLGGSQAGQNLMTAGQLGGAGLAIAGTTAAGIGIGRGIRRAIQPAQQPAQQPVQQIQPLQR